MTRSELLAVVTFIQHRPYLLGREFILRTDDGELKWLATFRASEWQIAQWNEQLQRIILPFFTEQVISMVMQMPCPGSLVNNVEGRTQSYSTRIDGCYKGHQFKRQTMRKSEPRN